MNYKRYFNLLLAMNQCGVYLTTENGHTYIMDDENNDGWEKTLRDGGVMLNNKIYGGALSAIDTFEEALRQAGVSLSETHTADFGVGGIGKGRIDKVGKGEGGIF